MGPSYGPHSYMGHSYVPSAPIAIWVHLMYSAQIIKQRLQELTLAPPLPFNAKIYRQSYYIRVTHIREVLYHGAILRQA